MRNKGPWSLLEALTLFNLVCKATEIDILRKSMSVKFEEKGQKSKRFEVIDHVVYIYDSQRVQVEEIIPLLVKPKRAKKHLKYSDLTVSWKTIAEKLQTRSVDDIRNFWMVKILPLFDESVLIKEKIWTEHDDIDLLEQIAS